MRKIAALLVGVVIVCGVSGCANGMQQGTSSGQDQVGQQVAQQLQESVSSADGELKFDAKANYPGLGKEVAFDGGVVTVEKVEKADKLEVYAADYMREAGVNEFISPRQGGQFVIVKTRVKNMSSHSWDLTCMFDVRAVLINEQGQQFDPIRDLRNVIGNPECNDSLNPGFDSPMTWVYEVPAGFGHGFLGVSDVQQSYHQLKYIDLGK